MKKKYKLMPEAVVISLNPSNPDVGTYTGIVREDGEHCYVFWNGGWTRNMLTPKEQKTLDGLIEKVIKQQRDREKIVQISGSKSKGYKIKAWD